MGTRRQARERAVQFLFQNDHNPPEDLGETLDHFWRYQRPLVIELLEGKTNWGQEKELPPPTDDDLAIRDFAEPLVLGVLENIKEIDNRIQDLAANWDLSRMAGVDRSILRLAAYEMLYRDDIPPVVAINEAVDIAKKFSTDESGKFVNGILDNMAARLSRPRHSTEMTAKPVEPANEVKLQPLPKPSTPEVS
tara:strand:+ start:1525 stop:2103 length:579 start_codon:yes stop_codon:yes gene_type:complete